MEYKSQRLYRDARIFSIYEGTTQLQVVAASRYISNGTYLNIMREMLSEEVADGFKPLKARVAAMVDQYEAGVAAVKAHESQDVQDFLYRRLYDMNGVILMSLLLLADASRSAELFGKSANIYVRMAESEVAGHMAYIREIKAEDLEWFKAR